MSLKSLITCSLFLCLFMLPGLAGAVAGVSVIATAGLAAVAGVPVSDMADLYAAESVGFLQQDDSILPLPEVPRSLRKPAERADYILDHFWDAMDFGDPVRSHDRSFMERNMVNFFSLFPIATQESLSRPVSKLLDLAKEDEETVDIIIEMSEKYFDSPDSPMRSEDYYIVFLEAECAMAELPELTRGIAGFELEEALKNRPGTQATDFAYITREGVETSLSDTEIPGQLLLFFYNPGCVVCKDTMNNLRNSSFIAGLVAEGGLRILALAVEGSRELWDETKASMPAEWTVAFDLSDIVGNGLYILSSIPVMYLLSSDHTVLLKDPSQKEVESYILDLY